VSAYHLAQVNFGRLVAPVDDPKIDDFRNALDRINALAEAQPGFVWRLTGEGNNATGIRPDENDPMLAINVSVWETPEQLAAFVYRTEHRDFVRRRHEWFVPATQPIFALWWVPPGHTPDIAECFERLTHLRTHGPSPHAFDFKHRFAPPVPREDAAQEEAAA
jgi:heme-degrading monooxygenase HmoA